VNDTTFYPKFVPGLPVLAIQFDPLTGDLWIGDVGQDTWEEVDCINPIREDKIMDGIVMKAPQLCR
jgi:hypothetical protein